MSPQGHKDRLSAVDASFLHQEKAASHMHVGALVIFEGGGPSKITSAPTCMCEACFSW